MKKSAVYKPEGEKEAIRGAETISMKKSMG